jgi:hypothetical protein
MNFRGILLLLSFGGATAAGSMLVACDPPPNPATRVPATGDNVDHYGRPTDPAARACYDKCVRNKDTVDLLLGPDNESEQRTSQRCYDKCAAPKPHEVCTNGASKDCTCPNPDDFALPPIEGTRTCLSDGTAWTSCDCTAPPTPEPEPEPEPEPAADPDAVCKTAIKAHCVESCADKTVTDRGPCEVDCMQRPLSMFNGRLKECTPGIADY